MRNSKALSVLKPWAAVLLRHLPFAHCHHGVLPFTHVFAHCQHRQVLHTWFLVSGQETSAQQNRECGCWKAVVVLAVCQALLRLALHQDGRLQPEPSNKARDASRASWCTALKAFALVDAQL